MKPSPFPQSGTAWTIACLVLFFAGYARAQLSPVFTNTFNLVAGQLYDLPTSGNNVRGGAVNPVTGNILFASTAGGSNHVTVVNGTTGTVIGALDATGVSGGTLHLLAVKVAEDGAIYACNLAAASSTFRVYRWSSEAEGYTNPPVVVYEEFGVAARFGDTMDIRGAGMTTQIAVAGNLGTRFKIIYPSEDTLTNAPWGNVEFNLGLNVLGRGIAFEGTNNAVYGKTGGNASIYKVAFDLTAQTSTVVATINVGDTSFVGTDYIKTNGVELISGITYGTAASETESATAHRVKVFQLTGPSNAVPVLNQTLPLPAFANGNGVGASDITAGRVVFVEPNNTIPVYNFALSSAVAPSISTHPGSETNLLAGGYFTLDASAGGTDPLTYQWYKDGAPVSGATGTSLNLTNVTGADSGAYTLIAQNPYGSATSQVAAIAVVPAKLTTTAQRAWVKRNGELFFLANDNATRGLAYNPATGNLIVVSRTPTNGVHVLSSTTGQYLRSLNMDGIGGVTGSTFDINMVAVSDEGAVFVCDLTTTGNGFAIYRWANDSASTQPLRVYEGDPLIGRVGDTLSVAGTGLDTTLFASSRLGKGVAVFTTTDNQFSWWPTAVTVDAAPDGFAGLGLYATATNEFWGKSVPFPLHKVTFSAETNGITAALTAGTNTMPSLSTKTMGSSSAS